MSYSLNSLKELILGIICRGLLLGLITGDTRSLDYSSYIHVTFEIKGGVG